MVKICELTLKVKHLPSCLNDCEKENFLTYFGAQQIKVITSLSKEKSVVYGKFESKLVAKAVLHRIHQLRVLDSIICVEYAEKKIADSLPAPLISQPNEIQNGQHFINYVTKVNAWNRSVGFDQPPAPYLRYNYPKKNLPTINNISFALDTVPEFYYQVLHLMNRMHLLPPFSSAHSAQAKPAPQAPQTSPKRFPPKSDSESEIESDPETSNKDRTVPTIAKRVSTSKQFKRPRFIKPNQVPTGTASGAGAGAGAGVTKENVDDVFEKAEFKKVEKIELKVAADCLETKGKDEDHHEVQNMEIDESEDGNAEDESKEVVESTAILTDEELAAERVPLKDLYVLPVFKDYHQGTPNSRLYIKNISKNVTLVDLERIYKRYYVEKAEGEANVFEIKLLTEGRMKGQAFITLESTELGQKAVKETNGYILKNKPLVVVFAKNIVKKIK